MINKRYKNGERRWYGVYVKISPMAEVNGGEGIRLANVVQIARGYRIEG